MADDCYGLGEAADELGETGTTQTQPVGRNVERGKSLLESDLSTVRKLQDAEKTATGAERNAIKDEIQSHYADAGEKEMTEEKRILQRDLQADSDVKAYIGQMSHEEYANLHMELSDTYGGATARMAEKSFKANKIPPIIERLQEKGIYTDSIKDAIVNIKEETIVGPSGFRKLKAIDDLSQTGLDAIKTGDARKTYSSMKSNIGEEITNDIFAMKIEKNYEEITKKLDELSATDKLFKKAPSKDELKVFEDISTGKRLPDGNSLEASYKMLDKLSSDAWSAINGSIKPLDELTSAQRGAVIAQVNKRGKLATTWGAMSTTYKAGTGVFGVASFLLGIFVGIPQGLIWYGTSTPTNIAEMNGLYAQFELDKKDMDDIQDELLCPNCLDTINKYINDLDNIMERSPISLFLSPWLGAYADYVRSYIETDIENNRDAIRVNYARMFGDMEEMGLVKKGNTAVGYVPTTEDEKINYYKGNIDELWDTGDEKWIKKYGEAIFGKGDAFSAAETPDQRPMSKVEAMLWYYSMEKQEKAAEYGSDLGVSDRTKGWDQKWSDFRDKVIAYGEAQDNAIGVGSTPEATGTSTTESGKMSIEDAMAMAIQNTMKREGLSAEKATERTNDEIKQYMARGMSLGGALEKLTGTPVQGSGEGLGLSGGSGGSGGGSTKTSTSENKKAFALELAKKGLSNLTKDEKEIATKQLEFKEAKKANSGTTLNEFTSDMSASEKKETVKKYVADDYKGMSGSEIQEAARVDKAATAAAILDNCCGGGR